MTDPYVPTFYFPNGKAHAVALLERKRATIAALCAALENFLSIDLEAQLADVRSAPEHAKGPDLEDLNRAQEKVDVLSEQLTTYEAFIADRQLPEDARSLMEAQLSPVRIMLKDAEQFRDQIQQAMEKSQEANS